ncbi:MAG: metallophosphoesterase [Lentisphaeria bacterium]|nr:metallophosphoesterase [Lentisphaeria bacterium]
MDYKLEQYVENTLRRFAELDISEKAVIFPLVSDLHTDFSDKDPCEPGERYSLNVLELLHRADTHFKFDFFADCGDVGLELPGRKTRSEASQLLELYAKVHHQSDKPAIICMGNHDYCHGLVTPAEFGNLMNVPNVHKGYDFTFGENASFGFYDLQDKQVRAIFLNTGNSAFHMDEREFEFLRNALKLPSEEWSIMLFMHICPHVKGSWDPEKKSNDSQLQLAQILSEYTGFGGIFCGDSHFSAEFDFGGLPGFITQGYGGATPSLVPSFARMTPFNSAGNMLAEIVVFDPVKRRINLLRMGAGGEEADRSWFNGAFVSHLS